MSKVTVDGSTCVGCGLCEELCPEVFKVNSEGVAEVKASECSQHDLADIAGQCPVDAIKVE
ncbi:MAG: ferredoxin [Candidatus Omnitrophica bacterium]|nr:ferredoxin [Candidatus Omnitrophota bacterium]MBU1871190.1 ferredoxin [Candidatus Omnitrophota bacterium]